MWAIMLGSFSASENVSGNIRFVGRRHKIAIRNEHQIISVELDNSTIVLIGLCLTNSLCSESLSHNLHSYPLTKPL